MFLGPFDPLFKNLGTLWKFLTPLPMLKKLRNKLCEFFLTHPPPFGKFSPVLLCSSFKGFYKAILSLLPLNPNQKVQEGHGLDSQGGSIWVISRVNEGLEFKAQWRSWCCMEDLKVHNGNGWHFIVMEGWKVHECHRGFLSIIKGPWGKDYEGLEWPWGSKRFCVGPLQCMAFASKNTTSLCVY